MLGSALFAPELLGTVRAELAREHFHRPANGALFSLLCSLADKGHPTDADTVREEVEKTDAARFGGLDYIARLPSGAATSEELPGKIRRVADKAARRRAVIRARELEELAREASDVGEVLDALAIPRPGLGSSLPWVSASPAWLSEEPPPRAYLLHDESDDPRDREWGARGPGMLPRGKVGILAATGGVGKTYALCGLALSLVTGRPWLGRFPVGAGLCRRVALILGEEDEAEARRRLRVQADVMGLPTAEREAAGGIVILPGAGVSLALVEADPMTRRTVPTPRARELRAYLDREAERVGLGWDAVIFDPLSRLAGADTETDNAAATRLIEELERFTKLPGLPSVIVAHHTTKEAARSGAAEPKLRAPTVTDGPRGASALSDGARWVAALVAGPPGSRLVSFGVVKSNYASPPRPRAEERETGIVLYKPEGSGGIRARLPADPKPPLPHGADLKRPPTSHIRGGRDDIG